MICMCCFMNTNENIKSLYKIVTRMSLTNQPFLHIYFNDNDIFALKLAVFFCNSLQKNTIMPLHFFCVLKTIKEKLYILRR